MSFDGLLQQTREALREILPEGVEVTDIELEGPHIVLYTKQLDSFLSGGDLLRQVAQRLRRRVLVRTDPSVLIDPKLAEAAIRELIPAEAEINQLFFEPETGEVTIEAANPGAAIGRQGAVLNDLKRKIGWIPTVVRTPPIPSKTVEEVRIHLRNEFDDRRSFLKKTGIRIARDRLPEKIWARSTSLGGYREVGRSAHLLTTQNSKVLIRTDPLLQRPGAAAPRFPRRRRGDPCPPRSLRSRPGAPQVRVQRADLLHRADPGSDDPHAPRRHQGHEPGGAPRALRILQRA
jgi:predicted metal-dependent RNase